MRRAATGGALVGLMLLAGCSSDVEMPAPAPGDQAAESCRALMAGLPDSLYGQERVTVRPDPEFAAAWGSPAIALRCGVQRPEGLRPDSQLTVVNDVAWLPQPTDRPTLYTAVGHQAYVEMTIPPSYSPPADALIEISDLITENVPALPAGEL
ncbi:hypothetical protein HDA32_001017 [Spinactinospora alkalitolerans]|uniref:DUF3515 domain-containing protein n=1 Tax=Spinactinospora alkalitolerans TaxID=687207 RepID=A0A852TRH6_9ACTN|nr:DUF3515 domain-containing protein [Spinactinospora alkalitolerans]NYE45897.1 hypothetical protein [Spinactinospora alkalitolerans]